MINSQLFQQIGLDSGALTMLGSIAHPMSEPGRFLGLVIRDDEEVARFELVVDPDGAAQVDVDLAAEAGGTADDCGCEGAGGTRRLRAGGHLLLHVSGPGRYAAVLRSASDDRAEPVFDSRRLDRGDLFTATVLRPGRYRVANAESGATARLTVSYPERGRRPLRAGEPVRVEVGQDFSPREYGADPTQGQVYVIEAPARIRMDLAEPFDRTPDDGRPRYRRARRPR